MKWCHMPQVRVTTNPEISFEMYVKLKPAQPYTTVTYMFWEILNVIVSLQFWGGGGGD